MHVLCYHNYIAGQVVTEPHKLFCHNPEVRYALSYCGLAVISAKITFVQFCSGRWAPYVSEASSESFEQRNRDVKFVGPLWRVPNFLGHRRIVDALKYRASMDVVEERKTLPLPGIEPLEPEYTPYNF
jgi:hypothetical protein